METFRISSIIKTSLKKFWSFKENIKVIYNYIFNKNKKSQNIPKLYYGGAIKGDIGGPSVKIQKLSKIFPEYNWNFNTVYLLSNSIYLNSISINLIKKKKLPILLNQNGVFYPQGFKGDWQKANSRMSKIYHSADYVIWQSNFCKKASEKFLGKRKGRGEILYNAVDTSIFTPNSKFSNKKFTFLITGNIRKDSNYRILSVLFALKEIIKLDKNIQLTIAGSIEDQKYLNFIIRSLKLEDYIIFLQKYTQKEAPEIYQKADAYITMSYQDNCPTAILEAMACGLPILYSSSGGVPELVGEEAGLGIHVEENWHQTKVPSKSDIINGMKEIIKNKINMSKASRKRAVEFFDIREWTSKHKLIVEKLSKKQ